MKNKKLLLALLLVGVLIVTVGCIDITINGDDDSASSETTPDEDAETENDESQDAVDGDGEDMSAGNYYYDYDDGYDYDYDYDVADEYDYDYSAYDYSASCSYPYAEPVETVVSYMDYTLGTLEGSYLNYDAAKNLLSYTLMAEWDATGDSFVPEQYCIQNGPDAVLIKSQEYFADCTARVRIEGIYGDTYMDMWDFDLEVINGEWQIYAINCVQ